VPYELRFAPAAANALEKLAASGGNHAAKLKKVRKALGRLQADPRYPALRSHLYHHFPGLESGKVCDSYVDNHVAGAWRIYWMYGPDEIRDGVAMSVISVLYIGPHS
jgi:hypothetical protein